MLGAVTKNEELSFEAQGISLTQALGRIGGLIDKRADASGVFIFRFEDAESESRRPRRSRATARCRSSTRSI